MKFSTGGILREPSGRTGAIPVATVKVWIKKHIFCFILIESKKTYLNDILGTFFFVDRRDNMSTKKMTTVGGTLRDGAGAQSGHPVSDDSDRFLFKLRSEGCCNRDRRSDVWTDDIADHERSLFRAGDLLSRRHAAGRGNEHDFNMRVRLHSGLDLQA